MQALADRGVEQIVAARADSEVAAHFEQLDCPLVAWRGPWILGLRGFLRRFRPTVAHAHDSRAHGHLAVARALVAASSRPRTVVTRRVLHPLSRHGGGHVARWKYRRGADVILCVSAAVRDVLRRDGLPAEQLRVVHDGIDLARIDAGASTLPDTRPEALAGAPFVLSVGALDPRKRHDTLIDAWSQVASACPEAHLVILGEGPEQSRLETMLRSHTWGTHVHLLGWREDVPAWLHAADVFAFPSDHDALGSSLLEAMAARLPIIAARAGGVPEVIVEDETGLLVPAGDACALGTGIVRLLREPGLGERLGTAAQQWVRAKGSAAVMAEATLSAYQGAEAAPQGGVGAGSR